MKSTVEILREAKSRIPDEAHWSAPAGQCCDGYGRAAHGTACMAGAVYIVANGWQRDDVDTSDTPGARAGLSALAKALGGNDESVITEFNDAEGRTLAEVHDAFDRAIASLEASS